MKIEDLQELSKEQLINLLLSFNKLMDKKSKSNKEAAERIGLDSDPGYEITYRVLRTMSNYMNILVIAECNKLKK